MKKFLVSLFAILLIVAFLPVVFAQFKDVPENDPNFTNFKAINWMQENGVINGYKDGTFKPYQKISRAEFIKMLYGALGIGNPGVVKPTLAFADLKGYEWYVNYVEDAYLRGIIKGYPDGTFKADNPINFAEAMKIVVKAFFDEDELYDASPFIGPCVQDYSKDPFVDTDAWYMQYLDLANSLCLFPGDLSIIGEGGMHPHFEVNRADVAEILYRAKTLKDNEAKLKEAGLLPKYEDSMVPEDLFNAEQKSAHKKCLQLKGDPRFSLHVPDQEKQVFCSFGSTGECDQEELNSGECFKEK